MHLINLFIQRFIFLLFIILFLSFLGAITIYQPSSLNSDGSGFIKIYYYTSDSNLVNSKVIGNYAFTEVEAEENFSSSTTEVEKVDIFKDIANERTHVVLEIDFKDINKISEAKGFSDINASWTKSDSGMVFNWIMKKNQNNLFSNLLYVFAFDGQVLSSNGIIRSSDTVVWTINPSISDFTQDISLTALIKPKDNSSCGLIGIELPIIIGGLFFFVHLIGDKGKRHSIRPFYKNFFIKISSIRNYRKKVFQNFHKLLL